MDYNKINDILKEALKNINAIDNVNALNFLKTKYIGKKGVITLFSKNISKLPLNKRPIAGKLVNEAKKNIKNTINNVLNNIKTGCNKKSESETIDVSLPGRKQTRGHLHPITLITSQICDFFSKIGFEIIEGPEIETEYYNFEALNMPKYHPARDMQDTFYISDNVVLRTHTSATQPRIMEKRNPPISIISPGKVYRCDYDVTHTPMFHQIEGLLIDKGISFGYLKGILINFIHYMFGTKTKIRFRPSFFPFTEPSAEIDIICVICNGIGCRICSRTGWLEILGSGMVHPAVFEKVNYNTKKYTGLAFGIGVERIAMIKYHIDDIRKYFENDFRFLSQF